MRTIIRWSIGASVLAACFFALPGGLGIRVAAAQTTLRMTWYSDGNEGEVMADLLRRFEDKNRDIRVVLDQVPFKAINENLPVQLASGQGPDIARVGDLGGLARYMLDLRPYLKNAAYWEANYGPFLQWMRVPGDTSSIPGFMTQLTVTGPFVNKTLAGRRRDAGSEGDLGGLGQGDERSGGQGAGAVSDRVRPFRPPLLRHGNFGRRCRLRRQRESGSHRRRIQARSQADL
jgi:hypothetical protein